MIIVDTNPMDLGTLKVGTPHSFKYVLTGGDVEAKITHIRAGCGSCTTASVTANTIQPGESVDFNVVFTPNGTGVQEKKVTVEYTENDVVNSLTLQFTATVTN